MADDRNANSPILDPDDEENIVIDTTSTEPLREAQIKPVESDSDPENRSDARDRGIFTSPRFGSAGSGGAELEPGPDGGKEIA